MKRCNPTSTSNTSCSSAATAASDEMKKRLEERTKQDQKYFPTLPPPPTSLPSSAQSLEHRSPLLGAQVQHLPLTQLPHGRKA